MKLSSKITTLTLMLGALLLSGVVAKADEISFQISPASLNQTVVAGDTTPVLIYATITDTDPADSTPLNLWGYEFTTAYGPSSSLSNTVDDSGFWNNFSYLNTYSGVIDPQQSITDQLIFAFSVSDPTTPAGLDVFGVQITGDQQGDLLDPTNAAYFTINVTSPTPEPSSLLLLVTGLTGLAGAVRRKIRA